MPHQIDDDENDVPLSLPEEIVATICGALLPIDPSPALRAGVLAVALATEGERDAPGLVTLRREGAGWAEMLPGVHARLLQQVGTAQSWLVRLEPGARAPAHDHPDAEECVVLEGELQYLGGARLRAGDYQIAHRGAHHTELVSEVGALVFLRYAQPLENYLRP
ncbi:MAG: cupin domain-containing protein [Betaproteobacteria bacterium]